jgi:hypothetical protein
MIQNQKNPTLAVLELQVGNSSAPQRLESSLIWWGVYLWFCIKKPFICWKATTSSSSSSAALSLFTISAQFLVLEQKSSSIFLLLNSGLIGKHSSRHYNKKVRGGSISSTTYVLFSLLRENSDWETFYVFRRIFSVRPPKKEGDLNKVIKNSTCGQR